MIASNSNNNGFTLIELLIVLVIAGILVTLAVPGLQGTVKSNAVRSLHSNFHNTLSHARSEAVSRNKFVTICPSNDGASCGGTWSDGWLVFVDNKSGEIDGVAFGSGNGEFNEAEGEKILRVFNNSGSSQVSMSNADNNNSAMTSLTWNYRGFVHEDERALVVVCAQGNEDKYARGLLVERSGRVMTTRDFNGDGIHDNSFVPTPDPDASPLPSPLPSNNLSCS